MQFKQTLGRRITLGRLGMPLWFLALAGAVVVAAAGQAVGPVLSGSVTGSAGLTVEQSVLLDPTGSISISGHGDDALGVMDDEGTNFTAAIELHAGDTVTITLPVVNVSDADANAILELVPPAGVDVEVTSTEVGGDDANDLEEAQMSKNAWLMRVDASNDDTLDITISPKDDLKPGFYTISGRIVQITG
ncbi:MAG: hypothetical protein HY681_00240 [Chloroflexi bacterium]|nr:hypothetical protein [Chloroflexota bacterium]